jgi:Zn-dependent protease
LALLVDAIPFLVVLILSLSFHEAAHAWTADRLGDPTARMLGRLTLNPLSHIDWIGTVLFPLLAIFSNLPLIGWAKPVPVNWQNLRSPRRDFAIVALAGPVSNLLIAVSVAMVVFLLQLTSSEARSEATLIEDVLRRIVYLNVLLAAFNLIPVPPLDGGNVLAGFVPEPVARVIDQIRPFGFLILYALILTGMLGALMRPLMRVLVRLVP